MNQQKGFSLLEVLISVAIVSILASLGYSSYQSYIAHTKRISAEITLQQFAQVLEQYYHEHNTYQGATISKLNLPNRSADAAYQFAIAQASDQEYVLQAIPQRNDTTCGTLSLDAKNNKSISGTGNVIKCWL